MEQLSGPLRGKLNDPYGPLKRAIEVMTGVLKVRPLTNNLTFPPVCQRHEASGVNNGKCSEMTQPTKCGIVNVPNDFIGTATVCNHHNDTSSCSEHGPNGRGVATDFLLFVQMDNDHERECDCETLQLL